MSRRSFNKLRKKLMRIVRENRLKYENKSLRARLAAIEVKEKTLREIVEAIAMGEPVFRNEARAALEFDEANSVEKM